MSLTQDLRFAVRTLRNNRLVVAIAIASLALIVAGNTVVFSIVNSLLVRPLDFDPEGRLMLVWRTELARSFDRRAVSMADFNDYRAKNRVFEEMTAYDGERMNLTGSGKPEELAAARISPSFFRVVEVSVPQGRTFADEEGRPGGAAVAILGHEFFERRFGGDPTVLGQTIELDRDFYEIVGVMEGDFTFIDGKIDVWLPFQLDPAAIDRTDLTLWPAIGKLRKGVTPEEARDDLAAIGADLEGRFPEANRGIGAEAVTFREYQPGPQDRILFTLVQGAGLFLLLIACANLANLLLARGQARRRELALRSAVGASRFRLVRQLLTESVVLALTGGAIGVVLGYAGVHIVKNALGDLPKLYQPIMDYRVLLFSLAISVGAGLVFGVLPALRASGGALVDSLKEGAKAAGATRGFLRQSLVVSQIALALVLLCGTGFMLKAFHHVQRLDPGFDDQRLLTFQVTLPEEPYDLASERRSFFERLLGDLGALPGVTDATAASALPRTYQNSVAGVDIPEQPREEGQPRPLTTWVVVPPGYFDMMAIAIQQGRDFTAADNIEATHVTVVDRGFAERFWPGEDPIGKRLKLRGKERMVIGVAADVVQRRLADFEGAMRSVVYLPWAQEERLRTARFMLRTRNDDPVSVADPARAAVWALNTDLPVAELRDYDAVLAEVYVGMDVIGQIIGGFGVLALLLAALGVYGVLAYAVSRRTREIGVRVALGASRWRVLTMVLRDGVVLSAVGLVLGLPAIWWVRRLLEGMVEGLTAGSGGFVLAVTAVLLAVILAASFAPARRAARLSPVEALRTE